MKMKDVIAVTGLTDRAIRLYIENGLVSPSCSESYAGRKNIDFTDDDVAELCNIAILRKAGFSISEIKLLRLDDESCRKVLTEFMSKTSRRIKNDKDVLEKLEAVAESETVTMQAICESLNSVTKEKSVPEADIKLTVGEKLEKRFFIALASAGLVYILGCILYIVLICKSNFDYLYPAVLAYDWYFFAKLFIVIFVVVSSVYLILNYYKRRLFTGRKKWLIKHTALSAICVLLCVPFFFFTVMSVFTPNACSKTTHPKNYLVLDEYAVSDAITEFFPYEIDSYATNHHNIPTLLLDFPDTYPETTKYYYKYFNEFFGGDAFVEISAEWRPLEKYKEYDDYDYYYKKHKEKYLKMESDDPVTVKTKGDWQCVYYDDSSEDNWNKNYIYRIFAFNDKTETVRFIFALRHIKDPVDEGKEIIPHYVSFDW